MTPEQAAGLSKIARCLLDELNTLDRSDEHQAMQLILEALEDGERVLRAPQYEARAQFAAELHAALDRAFDKHLRTFVP